MYIVRNSKILLFSRFATRWLKKQNPQDVEPIVNDANRDKSCALSSSYFTGQAETLHKRSGASVAAIVVSENEAQYRYSSASMHEVIALAGYQPMEPWPISEPWTIPMFRNWMMNNCHCWWCRPMRLELPLRRSRTSVLTTEQDRRADWLSSICSSSSNKHKCHVLLFVCKRRNFLLLLLYFCSSVMSWKFIIWMLFKKIAEKHTSFAQKVQFFCSKSYV